MLWLGQELRNLYIHVATAPSREDKLHLNVQAVLQQKAEYCWEFLRTLYQEARCVTLHTACYQHTACHTTGCRGLWKKDRTCFSIFDFGKTNSKPQPNKHPFRLGSSILDLPLTDVASVAVNAFQLASDNCTFLEDLPSAGVDSKTHLLVISLACSMG
jgi:hypothetical protein